MLQTVPPFSQDIFEYQKMIIESRMALLRRHIRHKLQLSMMMIMKVKKEGRENLMMKEKKKKKRPNQGALPT